MTTTILPTRNEAWGFWGTIRTAGFEAHACWQATSLKLAGATGASPEGVRDFLDSRYGRHFADMVIGMTLPATGTMETAIDAAISRHQAWRIDRRTSREEGIPAGLPWLTGWASHFGALAEFDGFEEGATGR